MAKDDTKKAPVKLLHAYWPEEDVRVDAGQIIELPLAEAKTLIAANKAERADPMPGEE